MYARAKTMIVCRIMHFIEMQFFDMILKTLCIIFTLVADQPVGPETVLRYKEVLQGETARFPCDLEDADSGAWDHIPVNSDEIFEVLVGRTPTLKYGDRFSINSSEGYELLINKIRKGDAGTFVCKIRSQQIRRFQLTVLESTPVCNSSTTSQYPVAENDCGLNPDIIQLTCKVVYFGVVAPVLIWENMNEANGNRFVAEEDKIVFNTIQTVAKWNVNTYKCMTKERKFLCYSVISQPFYAFNSSKKMSLRWPQLVTCSANSSHSCSYKWITSGDVVSTDQHLDLTSESIPGVYQCLAECRFREHTCAIQAHLISFEFSSNIESDRRFYTIVISVLSTVLLIAMIPYICKAYKMRLQHSLLRCVQSVRTKLCPRRQRHTEGQEEDSSPLIPLISSTTLGSQIENLDQNISDPITVKKNIKGVTVLGGTIYIVKYASKDIDRYDAFTLKGPNPMQVPKLQEPRDLVACKETYSLYVSDSTGRMVHKLSIRDKKNFKLVNQICT